MAMEMAPADVKRQGDQGPGPDQGQQGEGGQMNTRAHARQDVLSIVIDPECTESAAIAGVAFLIGIPLGRIRSFLAHRMRAGPGALARSGTETRNEREPFFSMTRT